MTAAADAMQSDTSATQAIAALRSDVFDRLTKQLGATRDTQRARLLGIDRATIRRMRERQFAPRLELALRMAEVLGTTVDELFERVEQ